MLLDGSLAYTTARARDRRTNLAARSKDLGLSLSIASRSLSRSADVFMEVRLLAGSHRQHILCVLRAQHPLVVVHSKKNQRVLALAREPVDVVGPVGVPASFFVAPTVREDPRSVV